MNQTLDVKIVIPSDYVLINKEQLKKLEQSSIEGEWWGFKDLMENVKSKDPQWVRENILERYREILDVHGTGLRIAFYPSPGQKWRFNAMGMKKFLDEYFPEIWMNE